MRERSFQFIIAAILLLLVNSCYEEFGIIPIHKNNVFNFILSPNSEEEILEARNKNFEIVPTPYMYYGGLQYELNNAKVRGQSATNFQRKSYSVNLKDFILFPNGMGIYTEFEKFKLLSLSQDYTYIENRISHLFLQNLGIWPLHTFYAEVMLNNHHQGLYLFVEDPEEYLFTNNKADVVLRRYYQNELSKVEVNPSKNITDSTAYVNRFYSIYDSIVTLKGEQLYNEMASVFNIQNYMRKMIFDFLILNGDYTDEIYFYGNKLENGSIYFDIIPWDYDDIFTSRPHEIGRDWAVGNSFGVRAYANHDEVKAVVGDRFIFSIEDDIDYVISIDDYLYSKYLDEVKFVLSVLTESKVDEVFQSTRAELIPLYAKPEIIEQSVFDSDSTSVYLLEKNIVEKSEFLKKRIRWMNEELTKQTSN